MPGRRWPVASTLLRHWPIVAIAALAALLILPGLGRDYLWEDEGDTAVLASNILQSGMPVAWDGVNFAAPDYGQRLKFGFVMISHPWLQYYAAALSFKLFGETTWAARLPFALVGLATIVLVYFMLAVWVENRLAAISAAILLTASVQFLLFSRQARNYSLHAFLTCLLIWQFSRLRSWRRSALFVLTGVLLFHAHPIGLAALGSLALLALVDTRFASIRRWLWPSVAAVWIYAAPWLWWSRAGYEQNLTLLESARQFLPRLLQFAVECASVTPLVGIAMLALLLRFRRRAVSKPSPVRKGRASRPSLLTPNERAFAAACVAVVLGDAVAMAATHSRNVMWVEGLHQTPGVIPLVVMLAALLIAKMGEANRKIWAALMLVFVLTRFASAAPWAIGADPTATLDTTDLVTFHVPERVTDRFLRTGQIAYIKSLLQPNPGVIARISEFLRANAEPSDVVVTNFGWEALYFHTRLPQGAKIHPSFPIYEVARARQLPDYLFGTERVRWIVWRRAWPAFFETQDCARILAMLRESGASTELVLSVPESVFENRANVHFRRFAGGRYIFPWDVDVPEAQVYRVDWDSRVEAAHQQADRLFLAERYAAAAAEYRKYLASRPADANALTNLGIALVSMGKLDEAIPLFRQVAELNPNDGGAQANLARALLDHGEAAEATIHASRAVALRPDDPAARELLAQSQATKSGTRRGQSN